MPTNPMAMEFHDEQRRVILRFLSMVGLGKYVSSESLRRELKRKNRPTTRDGMAFHLEYLVEKGLIKIQRGTDDGDENGPERIQFAAISVQGVDRLDGRTTDGVAGE